MRKTGQGAGQYPHKEWEKCFADRTGGYLWVLREGTTFCKTNRRPSGGTRTRLARWSGGCSAVKIPNNAGNEILKFYPWFSGFGPYGRESVSKRSLHIPERECHLQKARAVGEVLGSQEVSLKYLFIYGFAEKKNKNLQPAVFKNIPVTRYLKKRSQSLPLLTC